MNTREKDEKDKTKDKLWTWIVNEDYKGRK